QIPSESPFPVTVSLTAADGSTTQVAYVSTTDFGDTLSKTLVGELALAIDDGMFDGDGDGTPDEAYTNPNENCSWETTMDNVAGKIAVIRRGSCFFSQKIYNAQQAGAIGAIVCNTSDRDAVGGMAGGDSSEVAVIPSIFVDFEPCQQIYSALEAGETMSATFKVSFAFDAFGPLNYATPLSQVSPLNNIEFSVFNPSPTDAATDVEASIEILQPDGSVFDETVTASIEPLTQTAFVFSPYTPSQVGEYVITYTNTLNEDVLTRTFTVSDFTFAADNGNIDRSAAGTIEPSSEGFVEDGLNYDAGIFYLTGAEQSLATHASFMIGNPADLFTGDADADIFTIILYDTDSDMDGVTNIAGGVTYDDLLPVGFGTYSLTGQEQPFDLLTVQFDDPVDLRANNQYILMVRYNGALAGIGIPPAYAFAGNDTYIALSQNADATGNAPIAGNDVVFTDQLYTGGWAGADYNYVLRLHLDGFDPSNVVEVLAEEAVVVSPNPTSDLVNVTFDLAQTADNVTLRVFDFAGKLVHAARYQNVNQTTLPVSLAHLPSGTYFLSVQTPEGISADKITKF
ncbi:MAG: PA domain-containing protein, partial [Bacteroidota bacterium]